MLEKVVGSILPYTHYGVATVAIESLPLDFGIDLPFAGW